MKHLEILCSLAPFPPGKLNCCCDIFNSSPIYIYCITAYFLKITHYSNLPLKLTPHFPNENYVTRLMDDE
jgi:hypothetical protein